MLIILNVNVDKSLLIAEVWQNDQGFVLSAIIYIWDIASFLVSHHFQKKWILNTFDLFQKMQQENFLISLHLHRNMIKLSMMLCSTGRNKLRSQHVTQNFHFFGSQSINNIFATESQIVCRENLVV